MLERTDDKGTDYVATEGTIYSRGRPRVQRKMKLYSLLNRYGMWWEPEDAPKCLQR
jgi:hypothetical protein